MYRMSQATAFIVALLIMIFTLLLAPLGVALDAQQSPPEPTPECFYLEDGTLVCMSAVSATAVPATPTAQPASPLFPVVWLPLISK